jgi:hypothetical protein
MLVLLLTIGVVEGRCMGHFVATPSRTERTTHGKVALLWYRLA